MIHFDSLFVERRNFTIKKLMKFIDEQGYKSAGPHEEEYLKSRGMFSDNPAKYLTLIRYRVVKK